jgi:hypothetical protein
MPHSDGNGSIEGTIRDTDGVAVAGALVRVFTVRLRGEQPLGAEVASGPDGRYSVSTDDPSQGEAAGPRNVRVAVFDDAGHEVASSPVRFGIEGTTAIDLTVARASGGASEYERYVAALEPVLQGVALADASPADVRFLVAATGIPAADLEALIDASARAGAHDSSSLPAAALYAWKRQGMSLEPEALAQRSTDELVATLRDAVDAGIVSAQATGDLDTIRARIEHLELDPEPDTSAAIPEETRTLPDVTIHVRESRPGFFEANFTPTDANHIARGGYTLDTKRGLRGHTLAEVLDRAEANWTQNYPSG